MSPLVITLFVVIGILTLGIIVYISHALEKAKLNKARLKADLVDRIKRCERLVVQLPGQFMSLELKSLLQRIQLSYLEQLARIDRGAPNVQSQISALRNPLDASRIDNAVVHVRSNEIAKGLRFQLEGSNAQIVHAGQQSILSRSETVKWTNEVRKMLISLNLELFSSLGTNALRLKQGGQAKLAFERGLQYLSKLPERDHYQAERHKFEEQLKVADSLVVHQMSNGGNAATELTTGIENLVKEEEQWKRKTIYD